MNRPVTLQPKIMIWTEAKLRSIWYFWSVDQFIDYMLALDAMAHLLYYTQQTKIQWDIKKPKQIRNDIRKLSKLLTKSNRRYAYAWYNINLILYLVNDDNIQSRTTIYKCSWHTNSSLIMSHSACWFFYFLWQICLPYLFTSV